MLQRYRTNGFELLIDEASGEVFASVSGYARMSGKPKTTIYERALRELPQTDSGVQTAETGAVTGASFVRLIPEKYIGKWIIKDNPELAEKMFEAGVRVFLYRLAGYEVGIKSEVATKSDIAMLMGMMQELTKEVTDFRQYKQTVNENYPGIVDFNQHLSSLPALPTSDLITVREWLTGRGIKVEKGKLISFAQRVSSMYQSATHKTPQVKQADDGTALGYGYPIEAVPILEQAFKAFF